MKHSQPVIVSAFNSFYAAPTPRGALELAIADAHAVKNSFEYINQLNVALSHVNACACLPDPEKDIPALIEALKRVTDTLSALSDSPHAAVIHARAILSRVQS